MVGGERAPRLRDQVRHRQALGPAHRPDRVHHVVGVLPHRVVHAGRPGGARAVVVHAQPAAHVHVGQVEAHRAQLGVVAPDLLQPRLDVADVGDLAAEVEVHQLEDVLPPEPLQLVQQPDQLHRAQPELGVLAAALGPAARAFGRELDPNARRRLHAHLVGHLEQHLELVELLQHDHHRVPELLPHEREPHELLVLVAVADDEVVGALVEAQDGLELGLAAALEPHAVRRPELHDLLDHVTLLVDLDRIHRGVGAAVAELLDRAGELGGKRLDP